MEQCGLLLAGRIAILRHEQAGDDDVIGLKSGIDTLQPQEAVEQQAGGREEHQRQRDLEHDESRPRARSRGGDPIALIANRRDPIGLRCLEGGQQAEQDARAQRDDHRHHRDRGIEAYVLRAKHAAGREVGEQRDEPRAQQQTREAAEHAEHQTLGQKLLDQIPAARAEGRANGELAPAPEGAREQQARDVRAGDEQHHPHRALQARSAPDARRRRAPRAAAEGAARDHPWSGTHGRARRRPRRDRPCAFSIDQSGRRRATTSK